MHIPDGFLSTPVWATTAAASAGLIAYSVKRTEKEFDEIQIPLLGVTGAFIFAAQMINFPVGPGTSGHLVGGLLAAALLGPWAASLVLTVVLAIQCLVFQDGGLTAFGANALNMAFIATFSGYYVMRLVERLSKSWRIGAAVGAWVSVVLAAIVCTAELALSKTIGFRAGMVSIGGIHALIGIGEALITVGVLGFLKKTRPELVLMGKKAPT